MRVALHPTENRKISIEEYFKLFGHRPADSKIPDRRPKARCPYCPSELGDRAAAAKRAAHFVHPQNSGFCPSKAKAGEPYLDLEPVDPDPAAAARLKRTFYLHWRHHYHRLEEMVPYFSANEFVSLLDFANEKNIWAYRDLREEDIPYVLVLLADYTPWTGPAKGTMRWRKFWFRFWYTHEVDRIEKLWIDPPENVQLIRASLIPPARRNGLPNVDEDINDFYPIPMPRDFLTMPVPEIHPQAVKVVEQWFAHHPEFLPRP